MGLLRGTMAALFAAYIISTSFLPVAWGDLVFDDESPAPRQTVRVVERQPEVSVGQAREIEPSQEEQLSKSELLRRKRMRQELKNEDVLYERLEELRLRDEQRRTQAVLNAVPMMDDGQSQPAPVAVIASNQATQVVTVPVSQDATPATQGASIQVITPVENEESEKNVFISGRAGLGNVNTTDAYKVQGIRSFGLGLGIEVSDHVDFEAGYTYGEYGVEGISSNPLVSQYQWAQGIREPLVYKQNTIDAGLRFQFLGPDSKFRPFVGGGAGYTFGYMNYSDNIMKSLNNAGYRNFTRDYSASAILGFASTGFDVKLSKRVMVGATFKYYMVVSSRENQGVNNAAVYGYYAPGYNQDAEKQIAGGSIIRSSYYSVLGGVSFLF